MHLNDIGKVLEVHHFCTQFVSDTFLCNLQYISFVYRCISLFCRVLRGLHELGQALAGASFSIHSPPELHYRLYRSGSGPNPLLPF